MTSTILRPSHCERNAICRWNESRQYTEWICGYCHCYLGDFASFPQMQIVVGHFYRRKDDIIAGPAEIFNPDDFSYALNGLVYTHDGKCRTIDGSVYDLAEELGVPESCGCFGPHPRVSLEHRPACPKRIGFYGAPESWGVGQIGERRTHDGREFIYNSCSWMPVRNE